MRICVYCSSSEAVDGAFLAAARSIGQEIGLRGHELVYGGASVGLMGEVARAAKGAGAQVTGIIPKRFAERDLVFRDADKTIITDTMAERKALLIERADAFIELPGGFGTLEELSELLTCMQLGDVQAALVLLNTRGFYEPLIALFEQFYALSFARTAYRALYHLVPHAREALAYIEAFRAVPLPDKWFPARD